MCGRFTLEPTANFYERFEITNRLDSLIPCYNIAPGQMIPVVISQSSNRVVLMRWGLIRRWAKDEKSSYKMINARIETLTARLSYRRLLARNRCLIPASGYYEWRAEGNKIKTPYYIHPTSGSFVAFAGLYDTCDKYSRLVSPDSGPGDPCADQNSGLPWAALPPCRGKGPRHVAILRISPRTREEALASLPEISHTRRKRSAARDRDDPMRCQKMGRSRKTRGIQSDL